MEDQKQKRARILKFIKNNKIQTKNSTSPIKRQYSLLKKCMYSQKKQNFQGYQLLTDRTLNDKKPTLQISRQYSNQNLTLKSKFKFLLEENFRKILESTQSKQQIQKENEISKNKNIFRINKQKDKTQIKANASVKFNVYKQEIQTMKFKKLLNQEFKIIKYLQNLLKKSSKDKKKKSRKLQDIYLQSSFQLLLQFQDQKHNQRLIKNTLVFNRYISFFIEDINESEQINIIQQILKLLKNSIEDIISELEQIQTQTSNDLKIHQSTNIEDFDMLLDIFEKVIQSNTNYNTVLFSYLKKSNVNIDNFSMLLSSIKRAQNTKPKYPIPQERSANLQYTLFLDLDETLIHFDPYRDLEKIYYRPYVHRFLQEMSKFYELIVFTAGKKEYADWAIDNLDKDKLIKYRLYQRHTKVKDGVYLKDIQSTGRSLKDSIIVDNLKENFLLHAENGIEIKSYEGQKGDKELLRLMPILVKVAQVDRGNISETLQKILKQEKWSA